MYIVLFFYIQNSFVFPPGTYFVVTFIIPFNWSASFVLNTIELMLWNISSNTWQDASTTCSPPYKILNNNVLSIHVCHLTQFAIVSSIITYGMFTISVIFCFCS